VSRFFFITTYDNVSGGMISSILNAHPNIYCSHTPHDIFMHDEYSFKQYSSDDFLDNYIIENSISNSQFHGNSQKYTAYDLQHYILLEKTKHPLKKFNLTINPKLRINFLIKSWLDIHGNAIAVLDAIEKRFLVLNENKQNLSIKRQLIDINAHIQTYIEKEKIDCHAAEQKIFLYALARVISQDIVDLSISTKNISLEKLIEDNSYFNDFLYDLTGSAIISSDLNVFQAECKKMAQMISEIDKPWEFWQEKLLHKYTSLHLETMYFSHVNKPLVTFYKELGYDITSDKSFLPLYSKLISIQLNSNRPAQLTIYFDNIEEMTDDLNLVEVLVNIDDDDTAMHETLAREIPLRKFTIKYLTTPRPKSFCDLWEPINKLLTITDPAAYFLLNISDEMLFATKGWDTILKKYVGIFPDGIFRLRASRNKFRNYFDRWECSFAQDSIPITTKKWIDIGGNWNPCFGPDSFQQLVAFYLAKEAQFSGVNLLREVPIIDIKFHGDIPSVGISEEKSWKHNRDHIFAMQICQSYEMQLEAKRRAILLKAHISMNARQIESFTLKDDAHKKILQILVDNTLVTELTYKLPYLPISISNQFRKLRFYAYFGAGKDYKRSYIKGFAGYLKAKYLFFVNVHRLINEYRVNFRKAHER